MNEVQLCNMALGRIKAQPISDLVTDTSKSAVLCRTFYEPLRDALLREYPWAFSIVRQELAEADIENLTTHQYAYRLPTDPACLRIVNLLNEALVPALFPYDREGDYIFTDEPSAALQYVGRITDPRKFDPLFIEALAWRLASDMIGPMNGDSAAEPWTKYQLVLITAFGADAQEKIEPAVPSSRWIDERFDRQG